MAEPRVDGATLLELEDLSKRFPIRGGLFGRVRNHAHAVDGVTLSLGPRETLGVVGESGCGKSTLARIIVGLVEPSGGAIRVAGRDVTQMDAAERRRYRRNVQFVFQDPFASLNPRMRAGDIVREPILNFGVAAAAEHEALVATLFEKVGLRKDQLRQYPHEFSGGQRQRLGIARALAANPDVIVADEPVSALDVSVQAQVINLLKDLQEEFGVSYVFIAHDLAVVQNISHRVAVMYLGQIVEIADRRALFSAPCHPYTEALLDAVPSPDPGARRDRPVLGGEPPSPINPPPGCRFHTRCPLATTACRETRPQLVEVAPGHGVACHVRAPASSTAPAAG